MTPVDPAEGPRPEGTPLPGVRGTGTAEFGS